MRYPSYFNERRQFFIRSYRLSALGKILNKIQKFIKKEKNLKNRFFSLASGDERKGQTPIISYCVFTSHISTISHGSWFMFLSQIV